MLSRVGIVVPCKNEAATLAACLRSLQAQGNRISRIVVVDNGSVDGSQEIARRLGVRVVELPGVAISTLRNTGAELLGDVDVIGFVDADCEVDRDWLQAGLTALRHADMVGARSLPAPDAPWVADRWARIEQRLARGSSLLWSQHLLVRRTAFESLGGFDESMRTGEDSDLSLRLRAQGGHVVLLEDMIAVHHGFPGTLRRFVRRELWHTSTSGWFDRMAVRSRILVVLAAVGMISGVVAGTVSASRDQNRAVEAWLVGAAVSVPTIGWVAGRSPRHSVQDGILMSLWSLVRAVRLFQQLLGRRGGVSQGSAIR